MKAPRLWSAAAERDKRVGTVSLLGSLSRAAVSAANLPVRTPPPPPEGEGRVNPMSSKPACLPVLKNTGRVDNGNLGVFRWPMMWATWA